MPKRIVVDPHHHLWDLASNSYPWLEGPPFGPSVAGDVGPIASNYSVKDMLEESGSIDLRKSVHVETGWSGPDPVGETAWLQAIADSQGFPHGIVAHAALESPDVEKTLERHASYPNVRGIRQILNWHPDPVLTFNRRADLLTDPAWLAGYSLLRRHGLSFDLQIYPWQMQDATALAARYPDTPVVLNHSGMPLYQHGAGFETWRTGMRALAREKNVSVKISGLGMVDWRWTTDSIRPIVLETIEIFGVDRAMFASNFPVDRLYSSYERLFSSFEQIVEAFTELEKNQLFAHNAERIYRI